MKVKRHKRTKHILTFFRQHYGYKPPYQMLIDGTFCKNALKFKVNIMEQMPKYLEGEVHYFTTKCVLDECEALGTLLYGPLRVLRQYHVFPCQHRPGTTPLKCFQSLLEAHTHKFIVATQDREISEMVRYTSGVPLAYIAYKAINIEEPSSHTKDTAKISSKEAESSDYAMSVIRQMKNEEIEPAVMKKRFKRKAKEPHSLSCLKKKKRTAEEMQKIKMKKKEHRKKSKMLKKVKLPVASLNT